ncbi:MAG: hypothetical protein KC944_19705, partial [Candidatus Omnitrophica bacterium]|nr:hypothetical protein [Candidatus Omnitrophota bacterium]
MKKFAVGLCLVVMASLCAAPVSATLIGDEVTVSIFFSGAVQDSATGIAGTDDLSVVGFFSDELFTPTFSDTTITILYSSLANTEWLAGEFLIFSGLDWGGLGQLTGV